MLTVYGGFDVEVKFTGAVAVQSGELSEYLLMNHFNVIAPEGIVQSLANKKVKLLTPPSPYGLDGQ